MVARPLPRQGAAARTPRYGEAARRRDGVAREAVPRDLIRDYLVKRVDHGAMHGRADVGSALEEAGLDVPL